MDISKGKQVVVNDMAGFLSFGCYDSQSIFFKRLSPVDAITHPPTLEKLLLKSLFKKKKSAQTIKKLGQYFSY